MAAGWNKGKKLTEEQCRKISLGRLNSPILKAKKEETRRRWELEKRIRQQIKQQEIARRGWIRNSPQTREKISQAHKGQIAWNKGVKAWNNGLSWPDHVKENISKGMIAYWIQRKENTGRRLIQNMTLSSSQNERVELQNNLPVAMED